MSNGPSSPVDFSQELSAFLASAVSNGTWADVIDALKVDAVPAQATDITAVAGQLWANVQDDLFKATWERLFSARKLWAFADAPARDGTGSDQGLAVGDVCTLTDTPGSFFVCDTVAASTSTWLPAGGSGGGLQPLVVQTVDWVAGAGAQVESVPVGSVLYAIQAGGESSRTLRVQLPDSASVGDRVGFQLFGAPDLQPLEVTTPAGTLPIEGPVASGALVTLFDAAGELFDTAYLVWEYQLIQSFPLWKLVNYHQEPKSGASGGGSWSSVLAAGNDTAGQDAVVTAGDTLFFGGSAVKTLVGGTLTDSVYREPVNQVLGAQVGGGSDLPLLDLVTVNGAFDQSVALVDLNLVVKYDVAPNRQPISFFAFRGLVEVATGAVLATVYSDGLPARFPFVVSGNTLRLAIRDDVACTGLRVSGMADVVAVPGRSTI